MPTIVLSVNWSTKKEERIKTTDKSAVTKASNDKNIVVLLLIKYLKRIIYYIVAQNNIKIKYKIKFS